MTRDNLELRARNGIVIALKDKQWQELLRFRNQLRNKNGYVGIEYIDPKYHYGFAINMDKQRSDRTRGFTMSFRFLDAALKPDGVPIQVSWNPKVKRFQEYAPNESDPADFKPEVRNPPILKSR